MRKVGFVDLPDIKDPESKARTGSANGVFTFPFVTIENVDVVDADHSGHSPLGARLDDPATVHQHCRDHRSRQPPA